MQFKNNLFKQFLKTEIVFNYLDKDFLSINTLIH